MKMDGRRESANFEDRRKKSNVGKAAGIGIGGVVIALLGWILSGQAPDLGSVVETVQSTASSYTSEKKQEELVKFCSQVLASTEDFWTEEFQKMGRHYRPVDMVVYSDTVTTGCGFENARVTGPFYCPMDGTLYLDLEYFGRLQDRLGKENCEFPLAYVIGHEVGHHVQFLLEEMDDMNYKRYKYGAESTQYRQASVRVELQADFYSGLWAHHENARFGSLEDGDIELALLATERAGDDYLQQKGKGYVTPETFQHGRGDQRLRWFKKGYTTGDIKQGDTYSPRYEDL